MRRVMTVREFLGESRLDSLNDIKPQDKISGIDYSTIDPDSKVTLLIGKEFFPKSEVEVFQMFQEGRVLIKLTRCGKYFK